MPELPEVEVTRRGIVASLIGRKITGVSVRVERLRYPVPATLPHLLEGRSLIDVARRGKYLLLNFDSGTLLVHLGMSGSLCLQPQGAPANKHDHFDINFGTTMLRFHDPRRFGTLLWLDHPASHALLASLGIEPLSPEFTARRLFAVTRGKRMSIKQALMDNHLVVGIGNIYASESLFRAGIDPRTPAGRISHKRYARLVPEIRATLEAAIAAGGSSLRDYVASDGRPGYFQQQYFVYQRTEEPCRVCGSPVRSLRQAGRTTFYCPRCQR